MSILEWKKDGTVAVITMTNGENRHNPDFTRAMLNAFDEIEKDEALSSVIILSNDAKNWSQGIDIQWLMKTFNDKDFQAVKDFLYDLNRVFKRILLYPMPVIAAINGHAFGDGAILSCACDFRLMKSSKGFFCFPEIDINIPFLPGMMCLIKKAFPYYKLEEAVYSGRRYGAAELAEHHVIVKACEDDDALISESLAWARSFNKKRPIFGEMKRRFHQHIIEAIDREDPAYIEPLKLMM